MIANLETESARALKLGIFGGTFNPIHLGHLLIAQDAVEAFGLSKVLFVPAATPPHKRVESLATDRHRLAMVKLATRDNPSFEVSDIELCRGGVSYTIDTVWTLRKLHPRAELFLLIGSDSLNEFHTWHSATELARLCRVVAVLRPGEKRFQFAKRKLPGLRPLKLQAHPFDVSSTEVRERVRKKASVRYLVPEAVQRYIAKHGLYQRNRKGNP
jgi:nicotinate-nucleotide adenylyltransferase